jgi:hypothetical protein
VKKDGRWTSASWAGEWGSAQLVTTHQEGKDRAQAEKNPPHEKKGFSISFSRREQLFYLQDFQNSDFKVQIQQLKKTEEFRKDTLYMQENITRQHGCNKQVVYLCLYLLLIWKIKIFDSTKYDIFILK